MAADAVEIARAKVNLHLHVTGRRADGYHLLDSLVVFPEIGDRLEAVEASELSLTIEGPFTAGLSDCADNLVLRAAKALGGGDAALRLTKNLPVGSGIGGGSADAAAALRLLNRLWGLGRDEVALERIGREIGADVPVCVRSRPVIMRGVGEVLTEAPEIPPIWLVLVNSGVTVSTPEIFQLRSGPFSAEAAPPDFKNALGLAEWLSARRNDLQLAAVARHPEVAEVLEAIGMQPGALIARMSGSGATCFGLFAAAPHAQAAAAALRAMRPDWWVEEAPA